MNFSPERRKFLTERVPQGVVIVGALLQGFFFFKTNGLPFTQESRLQENMRDRLKSGNFLEIVDENLIVAAGATRLNDFASPAYGDDVTNGPSVEYQGGSGDLNELVYRPALIGDYSKGQFWLVYQSAISRRFNAIYLNEGNAPYIIFPKYQNATYEGGNLNTLGDKKNIQLDSSTHVSKPVENTTAVYYQEENGNLVRVMYAKVTKAPPSRDFPSLQV